MMNSRMVVGVYREKIFSPGKVREDAAILNATLTELSRYGYQPLVLDAGDSFLHIQKPACAVLSMAQSGRALGILEGWEKDGTRVLNSVRSVRNCYRKALIHLLAEARLPIPLSEISPLEEVEKKISFRSPGGYWLKRGDVHALEPMDVVKVTSRDELRQGLEHFRCKEIEEVLIQEHVEGEVVKFYGVGRGLYFSAFLASSGREVTQEMKGLSRLARGSAEAVGLDIYGGDAVVTGSGEEVLIDLNDWPSFSRCCQPAARRIAKYTMAIDKGEQHGLSSCG